MSSAATASDLGVEVGTFFVSSWGYDQTNVDFYKVVDVTASGKSVKVQEWSAKRVGSDHSSYERLVPGDGPATYPVWHTDPVTGERTRTAGTVGVMTKRLKSFASSGEARAAIVLTSYANGYLYTGGSQYATAAGAGH